MTNQPPQWRRSSYCSPSQCVEISETGQIRDSKNPAGPVLRVNVRTFLDLVKKGQLTA